MQPDLDTMAPPMERLRADLAAARATDRARLDYLAEVSHELKTPINGILGILGLLRRTALDAEQREMVELMWDSAEGQAALVAGLNRTARLDAGVEPVEAEAFSPRGLLASVVGLLRPGAEGKGLALRLAVADAGTGVLLGDAKALRRIAANLVGNAVKFTERGEVRVDGAVVRAAGGAVFRLVVSDTGPGIRADQRERVFGRFARGTTAVEGSGLGLHICKGLADAMGGTVVLGESEGGGCEATLEVPLAIAPDVAGAAS